MPKKYVFTLNNVSINKIDEKYGLLSFLKDKPTENLPILVPKKKSVTKVTELDTSKLSYNYYDESKRLRRCMISMIDFQRKKDINSEKKIYKCFWDKSEIPDDLYYIGCPLKYVPGRVVKSYFSELSKEKYTITEAVSEKRVEKIMNKKDSRFTVEPSHHYETDGVFCSFNCCLAFIRAPENKTNPIYRLSENLLQKIYDDCTNINNSASEEESDQNKFFCRKLIPAPHWRTLKEFGGNLSITEFRNGLNKVQYVNHGTVDFVSIVHLFENQMRI